MTVKKRRNKSETPQKHCSPEPQSNDFGTRAPDAVLPSAVLCQRMILPALCAIAVVLGIYYTNLADDYDLWFHLRYGEQVLRDLTWKPDHTLYSWTPTDAGWVYVSWLGSATLYAVHAVAGVPGLYALQWCVLIAIGGLVWRLLRALGRSLTVWHALAMLATGIAINPLAAYIKPEMFSYLCFAVVVFLYFSAKATGNSRRLWALPALFLLWVNTHGGFMFGLIFISLALAGEFLEALRVNNWCLPSWTGATTDTSARFRSTLTLHFAGAVALSWLITAVNPYGDGVAYHTAILRQFLAGAGDLNLVRAYNPLWQYMGANAFMFRLLDTAWLCVVMIALLVWLLIRARRTPGLVFPLGMPALLFMAAGFAVLRVSVFACLLWLFTVVFLAARTARDNPARARAFAWVGIVGLGVVVGVQMAVWSTFNSWLGLKFRDFVPERECEFIIRHKLPGPVFNDYLSGGYLIWALYPVQRVFIDPRYGPYTTTGVWEDYTALRRTPDDATLARLEAKYPFHTALLHFSGAGPLVELFLRSPRWQIVFFDRVAAVFVRRDCMRPDIAQATRAALPAARFAGVANPQALTWIAVLYSQIAPQELPAVRDIYARNVRPWYARRGKQLLLMARMIAETAERAAP